MIFPPILALLWNNSSSRVYRQSTRPALNVTAPTLQHIVMAAELQYGQRSAHTKSVQEIRAVMNASFEGDTLRRVPSAFLSSHSFISDLMIGYQGYWRVLVLKPSW